MKIMIKVIFIFYILVQSLFSYDTDTITQKNESSSINLSDYVYFTKDINGSLSAIDIFHSTKLKIAPHGGQIKNQMGPFWSKVKIKNNTMKSKSILLYNILPGTNYIDVYIYKNDKLIKKYLLGDMRKQETKEIVNRHSIFELNLEKNESYTIISKVDNYNINNVSWILSKYSTYNTIQSNKILIYGFIGGFFLLFIILNFALFITYKSKAYLILALYTAVYAFYYLAVQGLFYQLNIGINIEFLTLYIWIAPLISSSLLLLFVLVYFEIIKYYKKIYFLSIIMMLSNISVIALMTYAFFIDQQYFKYSFLIGLSSIVNAFFLLLTGLYMKEIGSKYFLLGQFILVISVIVATLSIYGVITFHTIYRDIVNIALIIDVILLLTAQYLKTRNYIKILENTKSALIEHARFTSMGTAITDITHQWKYPLSHIGLSVTLIETILKNKKEALVKNLEVEIPKMTYSLKLMKNTIDEFSNYYSKSIKNPPFH